MRFCILLLFFSLSVITHAEERLRLATTTSTENSGLMDVLNPVFEQQNNIKVDVIAVGTGKAIRMAENGDVDLILVHAPAAEKKFVEKGYGVERLPVMHNDFVILGPTIDPANVKQASNAANAMQRVAETGSDFISRGDDSGTHKKEMSLWQSAGVEPTGMWYISAGQGMGAVLTMANNKLAYTLTDRGTYLAYRDKMDLGLVFEGGEALFNPYHVILVNPEKHPHVKTGLAQQYIDFIRSPEGQTLIGNFNVGGERLFHPDVAQ